MAFKGFTNDTFSFLSGLTLNNDREWFAAHKDDYERLVVAPALALITAMDPIVRSISPHYRGVAKKLGGSLMRVYRDTRFGRDKTPYKTNIGIQFRHENAKDVHAPGWYFHVDLQECFAAVGTWRPEPADLLAIRREVEAHPAAWTAAVAAGAKAGLAPAGESLTRVPKGFDAAHPLADELRRKDFLLSAPLAPEVLLGPGLVDLLAERFRASAPYMAALCHALGAPF
jgi:uncharacterized protein (TIGR02453 family)